MSFISKYITLFMFSISVGSITSTIFGASYIKRAAASFVKSNLFAGMRSFTVMAAAVVSVQESEKSRATDSASAKDNSMDNDYCCVTDKFFIRMTEFSPPITSIWFRGLHWAGDFVSLCHVESNTTIVLGARPMHDKDSFPLVVSSEDIYDKLIFDKDRRLIQPADKNREIGNIRWSSIVNSQTTGPILDINPGIECSIRQSENIAGVPTMHMKCIKRGQKMNIEHNFYIQRANGQRYRYKLAGQFSYQNDIIQHPQGYKIVKGAHEFILADEPRKMNKN